MVLTNQKGWMSKDVMKKGKEKWFRKRPNFTFQKLVYSSWINKNTPYRWDKKLLVLKKPKHAIVPCVLIKVLQPYCCCILSILSSHALSLGIVDVRRKTYIYERRLDVWRNLYRCLRVDFKLLEWNSERYYTKSFS